MSVVHELRKSPRHPIERRYEVAERKYARSVVQWDTMGMAAWSDELFTLEAILSALLDEALYEHFEDECEEGVAA